MNPPPPPYAPPQLPKGVKISGGINLTSFPHKLENYSGSGSGPFNPDLPPPSHLLVKQTFGYFLMGILYIISFISVLRLLLLMATSVIFVFEGLFWMLAGCVLCYFFHVSMDHPEHLSGNPEISKMNPIWLSALLYFIASILSYYKYKSIMYFNTLMVLISVEILIVPCFFFMYFSDDFGSSFMLVFKPWRYRKTIIRL